MCDEPGDIAERILTMQAWPSTPKEAHRRCLAETSYKFLREVLRLGITLEELAKLSRLSKTALNEMLMGRRDIDLRSLSEIATVLGGRVVFSVEASVGRQSSAKRLD